MLQGRPKIRVYEEPAWSMFYELRAVELELHLYPTPESELTSANELSLRRVRRALRAAFQHGLLILNPCYDDHAASASLQELRDGYHVARRGRNCFARMMKKNGKLRVEDFVSGDNWCLFELMREIERDTPLYCN
jgi:hypothetical protein